MLSYLESTFTYAFISIKQKVMTYYNNTITKYIGFQELNVLTDNTKTNVSYKYILYLCLSKYISLIKYIRSYVDINTKHLHVVKLNEENKSAIILEQNMINFKHLTNQLISTESDNTMLNIVMFKFNLINPNENDVDDVTDLKNLITKYKDTNNNYKNVIKNILVFNEIYYDDNSKLDIKLIRNKKIIIKEIKLQEVLDKHINYFLFEM